MKTDSRRRTDEDSAKVKDRLGQRGEGGLMRTENRRADEDREKEKDRRGQGGGEGPMRTERRRTTDEDMYKK